MGSSRQRLGHRNSLLGELPDGFSTPGCPRSTSNKVPARFQPVEGTVETGDRSLTVVAKALGSEFEAEVPFQKRLPIDVADVLAPRVFRSDQYQVVHYFLGLKGLVLQELQFP